MDKRAFKDGVYERVAAVAKALASPKRIELLELLAQAERPVEWLADATGTSVANTSQHLQVLRRAHLVATRREGTFVWYRPASATVEVLSGALRAAARERDAEIGQLLRGYFGDRSGLDAMDLSEVVARAARGEVVIVDVRPPEEFAAAHVAGAWSAPLEHLDRVAASLPRDRVVVAYCRGPFCVFADEAVQRLRAAGFDARRLDGGLPEWRTAGLPVATA